MVNGECLMVNLVVYKMVDGEIEVSNKKGIIVGDLKKFKDEPEAVKYANELVMDVLRNEP